MRWFAICLLLPWAACSFESPDVDGSGTGDGTGDDVGDVVDPPWWDEQFGTRLGLTVTTGAVRPDKGYEGYTVRLAPFDTAELQTAGLLAADCADLRLATWDGSAWTERPYHLVGCGSDTAEVRFALPLDLGDDATWSDAYLYHDNAEASAPAPLEATDVYLWRDDAAVNRLGAYNRGRMDPWLASGHDNSLAWDAEGFYTFDTGDDTQSSYRRPVDERDVLVEAEWMHTGCYNINMQSGVCVRGIIESGAGGSEQADHYYCSNRAQNPECSNDDQDIYDGDIVKTDNEIIALQGNVDPPPIVPDQWRKQALAVFGTGPAELRFWDSDDGWPAPGFPPAERVQASGTDDADHSGRGFAGVMTAQDVARLRNIVIRRYVEPEPVVTLQ